eukprot:scaffold25596_cov74-Cyclotella_meneghiniana.AAC.3
MRNILCPASEKLLQTMISGAIIAMIPYRPLVVALRVRVATFQKTFQRVGLSCRFPYGSVAFRPFNGGYGSG